MRKANGRVIGVHVKEGRWCRVEISRCQGPYLCSMCVRGTSCRTKHQKVGRSIFLGFGEATLSSRFKVRAVHWDPIRAEH